MKFNMEDNKVPSNKDNRTPGIFRRLVDTLIEIGLGESLLRVGTTVLSVLLLAGVIWLLRIFYLQGAEATPEAAASGLETVATVPVEGVEIAQQTGLELFSGVPRLAQ